MFKNKNCFHYWFSVFKPSRLDKNCFSNSSRGFRKNMISKDPGQPTMTFRCSELSLNDRFYKGLVTLVSGSSKLSLNDRFYKGFGMLIPGYYFLCLQKNCFRKLFVKTIFHFSNPPILTKRNSLTILSFKTIFQGSLFSEFSAPSQFEKKQ